MHVRLTYGVCYPIILTVTDQKELGMTTVRQFERLWTAGAHARLTHLLLSARPEGTPTVRARLAGDRASAALILIRLDELHQAQAPLYSRLVRHLVAAQDADGGWDDPATTAVCLRALMLGGAGGVAVDRGLDYLAVLQKDDGAWPAEPLRRMPGDGLVTALVLGQLAGDARFRGLTRYDAAVAWMGRNADTFDPETCRLWARTRVRCTLPPVSAPELALLRGAAA